MFKPRRNTKKVKKVTNEVKKLIKSKSIQKVYIPKQIWKNQTKMKI